MVGVIVALLVALTVLEQLVYRDRILPGVEVGGTNVSGDDEDEASTRLDAAARRIETEPVRATADGTELTFDRAAIEYQLDVDASVRAARQTGRSRNPLDQVGGLLLRRVRPDEIEWQASWDDALLGEQLDAWSEELSQGLENGGLTFEGANVIEVAPKPGIGLQRDEALRDIEAMLRDGKDRVIELEVGPTDPPVDEAEVARAAAEARDLLSRPIELIVDTTPITITPDQLGSAMTATPRRGELQLGIDAARLRVALGNALTPFEVAPADASFAVSDPTVTINPSTTGQTVDLEQAARVILRGKRRVTARKAEQPAGFTTEMAQALNITQKVSEFTTYYTAGQPRVLNIQKGCGIINGVLVRPGDVFSLNDTLGPRTLELGWVNAPAFATGEGFFETAGGGVSQLSTTVFNATFFGGYEDVTHMPHTIYISRYPMGREATLDYPGIDNQFRNDSGAGVLIQCFATDTSVTVAYYGNLEGKTVEAEGPNILEEIPSVTECVEDPAEAEGEVGYTGYRVENFRVIREPGQPDIRERFAWEYDMRPHKTVC